jgi:hypothetical protein
MGFVGVLSYLYFSDLKRACNDRILDIMGVLGYTWAVSSDNLRHRQTLYERVVLV